MLNFLENYRMNTMHVIQQISTLVMQKKHIALEDTEWKKDNWCFAKFNPLFLGFINIKIQTEKPSFQRCNI